MRTTHRGDPRIPRRLIVAVGGNALDTGVGRGTPQEQVAIAAATAKTILPLLELDNQIVIVHGNGPIPTTPHSASRPSRWDPTSTPPKPRR